MQTERVTFLTTRHQKAALDAFAANSGHSVGHVLREASSRYMAGDEADDEEALTLLAREVEEAVPRMQADIREAVAAMQHAFRIIDDALAGEPRPA